MLTCRHKEGLICHKIHQSNWIQDFFRRFNLETSHESKILKNVVEKFGIWNPICLHYSLLNKVQTNSAGDWENWKKLHILTWRICVVVILIRISLFSREIIGQHLYLQKIWTCMCCCKSDHLHESHCWEWTDFVVMTGALKAIPSIQTYNVRGWCWW